MIIFQKLFADVQTVRIIFENFPNLVKTLNQLTTDKELQMMTDQYFEVCFNGQLHDLTPFFKFILAL